MVSSLSGMHALLAGSYVSTGLWVVAGALAAAAWLLSRLFGQTPKPTVAESAADSMANDLSSVRMNAPVLTLAAGLSLTSLGNSMTPGLSYTEFLVPSANLNMRVASATSLNGAPGNLYNSTYLSQTTDGSLDEVSIVSQSNIPHTDIVSTYRIGSNVNIAGQRDPGAAYHPFYQKDSRGHWVPSVDALVSLRSQIALLEASKTATPKKAISSIKAASAANKVAKIEN